MLYTVQQWKNEGLQLSTSSNEAAKLYDVAISQVSVFNTLLALFAMSAFCTYF